MEKTTHLIQDLKKEYSETEPRPTQINYMGLRKIFESTGNRENLDKLVLSFLKNELSNFDRNNILDIPFLKGVELQKDTIKHLTHIDTYILILQGTEPQNILISHFLKMSKQNERVIDLFKRGLISIQELQDYLNKNLDINTLNYIFDNRELFEGLDFKPIKDRFFSIAPCLHIYPSVLEAALRLLREVPFTNAELSWFDNNLAQSNQHKIISMTFFKDIFEGLSLSQRIDLLYNNENFIKIFQKTEGIAYIYDYRRFGYETDGEYETAITEFIESVIKDGYPHIAFATGLTSLLYKRRLEILNAWIEEEKTLELDIYALPFIEGAFSLALDDRYSEELQKRNSTDPEKKFEITPVDQGEENHGS